MERKQIELITKKVGEEVQTIPDKITLNFDIGWT